ncbi:MAG: hypothetical protein M3494_13510 [Actinomycetota bacterium]|nr:hypothetical protein [Actinomycetota bacterium]
MKLPSVERAFVEDSKLGYLLRAEEKGGFFEAVGFSVEEAGVLREALLGHVRREEVRRTIETEFGVKYALEGTLESPDGRNPEVRSVWIEESGSDAPRFITAYPHRRRRA